MDECGGFRAPITPIWFRQPFRRLPDSLPNQFTEIVPKSANAPQALKNRVLRGLVARIAVI
jgi:hypothetical protein